MGNVEELPGGGGLPDFLRDPVGILRRRWPWMLLALVVGLAATTAYVAHLKPRYRAEATLLVASQQVSKDYVRPAVETNPLQQLDGMVGETLASEALGRIIERHGLYPELRGSSTLAEIAELMREDVTITPEPGIVGGPQSTLIFSIAFEADAREVAAAVANDLADLFVAESLRRRTAQGRLTTGFLRGERERAEELLREQNRKITEFKEAHRGELPSELDTNVGRLERLGQQRQSLVLQIAEAENRLAMFLSEEDASPEGRLEALRRQLEGELAVNTKLHPDVVALQRRIEALEASTAGSERSAANGAPSRAVQVETAQRSVAELRAQGVAIDEAIRSLDERVARTPALQAELGALEEREGVLRESYLELLRKAQEAELAENLESSEQGHQLKVLDRAAPPAGPTKQRWRFLVGGVVASLALSLGVALVLESLDAVLVTTTQLESLAGARVLGSVPRIS